MSNPNLDELEKIPLTKKRLSFLPENPGIYLFWGEKGVIYIGKAASLKKRLASYFAFDLSPKTKAMIGSAKSFSLIKVNSELEALLLEAKLIHKFQPKYNFVAKDDKHPLYITVTKEKYPRVVTTRKNYPTSFKASFGPFPSSRNVYSILRMMRRIFPYSDHKLGKRPCLHNQIGLCDPCPNKIPGHKDTGILRKKYLKNIKNIIKILKGDTQKVIKGLKKEMVFLSKEEKYEEAAKINEQIKKLDYITQPIVPYDFYLENPNLTWDLRNEEAKSLETLLNIKNIKRIECYDVSHHAGRETAASMVTFINGEAEKSLYRHFRVRQSKGADDLASLKEVGLRRTLNPKWGRPDLIIVDGGVTQTKIFAEIFKSEQIPVVGLAKQDETLVFPEGKQFKVPPGPALNLLQRIRNEAHRFAQKYHHHLFIKGLLTS